LSDIPQLNHNDHVEDLQIEEEMKDSYLTYAMSVIVSRALPRFEDGLKPSQRRILVAMNDLGLTSRSRFRKCAKIAGDTSGNYHPHGESVVYPTLVRLAQDFSMRYPLIEGQGNFGSIDGDPPAAMRYTEARLTRVAEAMLEDMKLDTVDYIPNYDETTSEPVILPGKFPNLLCNGSQGIAVGMATSMAPHNLTEICSAIKYVIDKPECDDKELLKVVKGPDFPTGGIICGVSGIREAYLTGRGKVTVRARIHVEEGRGGKQSLIVTEIPYAQLKSQIIERIAECVKKEQILGIADLRDESDREGMRLVIELKRGEDSRVVTNQLFEFTTLQTTFSIINIALVNNRPRTLNLKEMLQLYVEHRKTVIRRRTMFLLARARRREHILVGLLYAVANIDDIIETIKKSPDVPTAKQALMSKEWPFAFKNLTGKKSDEKNKLLMTALAKPQAFTSGQADAILAMQLQRLTGLEIEKLRDEWCEVREEIEGYEAILADERLVLDIIVTDLDEMKDKFGDARRTEITSGEAEDFNIEDLIAEENVVVTVSHQGYIKRTPLTAYRRQGRGGQGVIGSDTKDNDFIQHLFVASTHDYILFFSNQGQCYWLKVYDVPQLSRQSRGRALVNVLEMRKDETVAGMIPVREFDDRNLVMATADGTVKKTELAAYSRPKRGGIIAINLTDGDSLIGATLTHTNDEIVLGTREGYAIRFNESECRAMGRATTGVRGIKLRKGDRVISMTVVNDRSTLLTVCENGFGKRTEFSEYRLQGRGGMGIINIRASERNGKVIGMMTVSDGDDLVMITTHGMMQRIAIKDLRTIGRATQGVRIIRLKEGDLLQAVACVQPEDNEPGDEAAPAAPAGEPAARKPAAKPKPATDDEDEEEPEETDETLDEEDADEADEKEADDQDVEEEE
jgi:DNA gyrase subunit A